MQKNECALFACSETAGKLHLTVVQTRADGWTWARSATHATSLLHTMTMLHTTCYLLLTGKVTNSILQHMLQACYILRAQYYKLATFKLLLALLQRILALGAGLHGQ